MYLLIRPITNSDFFANDCKTETPIKNNISGTLRVIREYKIIAIDPKKAP